MPGTIIPRLLVTKNEVLIYVDYNESYGNKQQVEIQSAYFAHTRLSIFTAYCYFPEVENKMISESVTIRSDLSDLSRAAAITSVLILIDYFREKHQHVLLKNNSILWNDGCSAQFQSQFVFKLLSSVDSFLRNTWCYNERCHGKRPVVDIGVALKNCVYRDVMSGESVIDTLKPFAEHADKADKDITSLYLLVEDVLIEPYDIEAFPRIKDTVQTHIIKRFFYKQNVPYLQVFKMATNKKPIFTQFYAEGA